MINTINFLGQITRRPAENKRVYYVTKPIECDCFVKKTIKKADNEFINWATDTKFIPADIKYSLSKENLLGKGFSNFVYKIDGNKDYVIRFKRYEGDIQNLDFSDYEIIDVQDRDLKGNFGQPIAELRSKDKTKPILQILKRQKGITNGNPPTTAIYHENGDLRQDELPYEAIERKKHYSHCLRILANLPQESYDKLVRELSQIGNLGYRFDYYNPNNFMLDENNSQINIIDLEEIKKGFENDLGNALWALSDIMYLSTFMSSKDDELISDEEKNAAFQNTITIIDKYVKALKNNGLKFSTQGYEFYTQVLDSLPMSFYLATADMEEKCQKLREIGVL